MEHREVYAEVKCDYNNGDGFWCVDAWRSKDDNEEGKVIAAIHERGNVFYIEPEARFSPLAQEAINAKLAEIKCGSDSLKEYFTQRILYLFRNTRFRSQEDLVHNIKKFLGIKDITIDKTNWVLTISFAEASIDLTIEHREDKDGFEFILEDMN